MRIQITNTYVNADNETFVEFTSELGHGVGIWMDKRHEPGIQGWYFVEFEVMEKEFVWGMNIGQSHGGNAGLKVEADNTMVLQGRIEVIDKAEGYCLVRLGDSLLSLGTSNIRLGVGDLLEVKTRKLLLFNENL